MPELVETPDFLHFRFRTEWTGRAEQRMALFPQIGGLYAMLSRQDNENIHLMYSDNVHFWNEHEALLKPAFPWETIQIGNCGSPIETEAGWLVLSHGVGPMRQYSIGAFLLDRDDPSKVIGRLREPLLSRTRGAGRLRAQRRLYVRRAGPQRRAGRAVRLADHATGFATVPLTDVLASMN
jgi:predicted GH43/DUF377 family glycosyl hydrolase